MLAPICLFTYNRPEETRLTLEALQKNFLAPESDLIIFSDGPKNEIAAPKVAKVREYIQTIGGFKSVEIIESTENKGLANSIIQGVTQIIEKYGRVIVLEDDLITSPNFLNFMNQALDFYQNEEMVKSVNGYSLFLNSGNNKNYFQLRPFPWGWATWKDRWKLDVFDKNRLKNILSKDKMLLKKFNSTCGSDISQMLLDSINNKNDSWYVRWTFDHFYTNKYSLFPSGSFVSNIGHNTEGTHCKGINSYKSAKMHEKSDPIKFGSFIIPDQLTIKDFLHYFTLSHKLLIRLKLLTSKNGRRLVFEDVKLRIKNV